MSIHTSTGIPVSVVHVNDWFNPAWGGGFNATFSYTLRPEDVRGGFVAAWQLAPTYSGAGTVSAAWMNGFQGQVSSGPGGALSTVGQSAQAELQAGDTLTFTLHVVGAAFDPDDFLFAFTDLDPVPDGVAPGDSDHAGWKVYGDGDDRIFAEDATSWIDAGDGDNEIHTGDGDDRIRSGSGNDRIFARDGDNEIEAGDGRNEVYAGSGDDVIVTGGGNDRIYAGGGRNEIDAGDGRNEIHSGSGDDIVVAGSGSDMIFTQGGNDVVDAGGGGDIVHLGGGDDTLTFVWSEGAGARNVSSGALRASTRSASS